jgi:hypothetical protein
VREFIASNAVRYNTTEMPTEELSLSSSPRESEWIAKPRQPRFGVAQLAFSGLAIYLCLRVIDIGEDGRQESLVWIGYSVLFVVVSYVIAAKISEYFARRQKPSGQAVLEAALEDQFSVEIHLVVQGMRIGRDWGVLWFGDGLMGFSGSAMSFVLSARDVAPQWERVRIAAVKNPYPVDSIVLVDAPNDAYLFVTPLAGQTQAYRKRLYEFKKENALPNAERHWPPLHRYSQEERSSEPVVRR